MTLGKICEETGQVQEGGRLKGIHYFGREGVSQRYTFNQQPRYNMNRSMVDCSRGRLLQTQFEWEVEHGNRTEIVVTGRYICIKGEVHLDLHQTDPMLSLLLSHPNPFSLLAYSA